MYGIRSAFPFMLLIVLLTAATAVAQPIDPVSADFEVARDLIQPLALAAIFTIIGVVMFGVCIWLIGVMTPFSVRKEIEEDQNVALAIIIGSMILGIAIILAACLL